MYKMLIAIVLLFSLSSTLAQADEDSVNAAYYLCAVMDGSGLTSKKCEISGWNSEVLVTIDMSSNEARKLCSQIVALMKQKGKIFDDRWELKIFSPYSNGNSIAFCNLKNG